MSRASKSFIFCVHAHQPVGNFDVIFKEAYEKCYRPFFEVLKGHPNFPVVCHLSGSLLDWLEAHEPGFLDGVRPMVQSGQIEVLGGAYYEPIYGAIPKRDLEGQIDRMRDKVKTLFGQTPKGVWLTERVWDTNLVGPLCRQGVEYTALDDFHLEKAQAASPPAGFYQTKDGHDKIDLFAASRQLRYLMPFRPAKEALSYIHSLRAGPDNPVIFADDCEKFGLWPGTFEWVYERKWLDQFFSLLEKDASVKLYTFSQFRQKHRPLAVSRVPHASYAEMMDWSGGSFYNFFDRYPESRYMRDRMLQVSESLQKWSQHHNGNELYRAKTALYQAQCNCAYWHGVFGGLYLHHLRSAVFENLIKTGQIIRTDPYPFAVSRVDFESGPRWRVHQKKIQTYFNPSYGGAMEELDDMPRFVNLMCNLKRRPESYHKLLSPNGSNGVFSIHRILGLKEKGLEKHLFYDQAQRLSFMDHVFEKEISMDEFRESRYEEAGDFVGKLYEVSAEEGVLYLERNSFVRLDGEKRPLRLSKTVVPGKDASLDVRYELKNPGENALDFVLGVEFNFSIGLSRASQGFSEKETKEKIFYDNWRGIEIRIAADSPVNFLAHPVETVSGSESGLERTYQQLGILIQKNIHIQPNESKRVTVELEVR